MGKFIYQGLQALPTVAVPDSTEAVIAAGYYEGTISVEVYCGDRI